MRILPRILVCLLLSALAFGAPKEVTEDTGSPGLFSGLVYSASFGRVWAKGGETQTFFSDPVIERSYVAEPASDSLSQFELSAGLRRNLSEQFLGWFSLGFGMSTSAALNGRIWDDADPAFDNFTYQYGIRHTHFSVKSKVLMDAGLWSLKPYVGIGVGLAFNQAKDYTSTPTVSGAVSSPDFDTNTQASFTYSVGVGVQRPVCENWEVGLGYEFSDWGKSQLGAAPGQTLGTGLSLDHLYTHAIMLNVTFVN